MGWIPWERMREYERNVCVVLRENEKKKEERSEVNEPTKGIKR